MAESDIQLCHVASDGSHHALVEVEPGAPEEGRIPRAVAPERRDPTRQYRCAEPDCRFFLEVVAS